MNFKWVLFQNANVYILLKIKMWEVDKKWCIISKALIVKNQLGIQNIVGKTLICNSSFNLQLLISKVKIERHTQKNYFSL